jgi:hypothetical protein
MVSDLERVATCHALAGLISWSGFRPVDYTFTSPLFTSTSLLTGTPFPPFELAGDGYGGSLFFDNIDEDDVGGRWHQS